MDVRIDESGKDVLAGGVDHFGAGRRRQIAADRGDRFAFAQDVGDVLIGRRRDLAVLDEQRHANVSRRRSSPANHVIP